MGRGERTLQLFGLINWQPVPVRLKDIAGLINLSAVTFITLCLQFLP